jgi:PadR family transcriptional regulator PadR
MRDKQRWAPCHIDYLLSALDSIVFLPEDRVIMKRHNGSLELMIMLAIMRLEDAAYGVPISREIEEAAGREVAMATVYASLDRLEARGLVKSKLGDPTPERGGRAKRLFTITAAGIREVQNARRALTQLWNRLPQLKGQLS